MRAGRRFPGKTASAWSWGLAFAVVVGAWLSSLHRVVHVHESLHAGQTPSAMQKADGRHLVSKSEASFWQALFASHDEGDAPCVVLDHAQSGDVLLLSLVAHALPGAVLLARAADEAIACWHLLAQARGPPFNP